MVQDTGYGTELYRAVGDTSRDQVLMYGLEETETPGAGGSASTPPASVQDYSNLRERQVFYVVSPPGETKWVKRVSSPLFVSLSPAGSGRSRIADVCDGTTDRRLTGHVSISSMSRLGSKPAHRLCQTNPRSILVRHRARIGHVTP